MLFGDNFMITQPTILIDKNKTLNNIKMMSDKALKHNLIFRPHFKTHQSIDVGRWFRFYGVEKITVSSLKMAKYFASDNWDDITVAIPVNLLEIDLINELAAKLTLNLTVDNDTSIEYLINNLDSLVNIYIKIDTGYNRAGIKIENFDYLLNLIEKIQSSPKMVFKGFISHAGMSYHATNLEEIAESHYQNISTLNKLKDYFTKRNLNFVISTGDTPTCSKMNNFEGIDEIRPGVFVYYDIMQEKIGSCQFEDIAMTVACPVISKYSSRNEVLIYGGSAQLSKDSIVDSNSNVSYGKIVKYHSTGWSEPLKKAFVKNLSQEIGIIKLEKKDFEKINVGDIIGIVPVHACLTVLTLRNCQTLDGEILEILS